MNDVGVALVEGLYHAVKIEALISCNDIPSRKHVHEKCTPLNPTFI